MPNINVTARAGDPAETDADTRVVGLFEGEDAADAAVRSLVDAGEAKPALGKLAVTHEDGGGRLIVVGLGKRDELDAEKARVAAAGVAGRAKDLSATALSWAAPAEVAGAVVEGTLIKLYEFDQFKTTKDDDDDENGGDDGLQSLEIAGTDVDEAVVEASAVAGRAVNRARDLQNLPGNVATPEYLAGRAREIGDQFADLEVEVFGRAAIAEMGMGAFTCVAQGTYVEPQMIVLRYTGGTNGPHLGFVGKAVTFDTGGISLKPGAKMSEMKFDMSGGAAVLEAVGAIAELGLPITLTAVLGATENMPGGHSVKPGDIVTAMSGKTIEINNTDAEGRLVLADILHYTIEQGAERVVNLATLTGAILVALGSTHCGLFSNDDDWFAQVDAACTTTGELGWRLPLHRETAKMVKGKFADLDNAPGGRKAGSITAAEFLKEFVGETPWVHMDIAGTAWELGRPYVGNGASGFGVRTLIELARGSGA
ncbi:MAG TPA: leucyl aminopeptidase [Thermoleophilaceae bacterium]|nr:leucyl aminopeptidase [Thermoleophilaceae bacterium]